ncbi:MAG: tol-pal system-associated acyl-CoA thioesterase [Sulfuriflexus sp.]|nr:tol-pal system-associated acyl-CoA thioesterase [Sulfuriflexus sp.]
MTDFLWPIRVYYEDTDAAGVVYYANYLKFMERARTEYVRSLGFEQDALREQDGIVFVVRNVSLQLHKPARFNDELEVVSNIQKVARTNLIFTQIIRRVNEDKILSEAEIQIVSVNAVSWKPQAIPENVLQAINNNDN